MVSEIKASNSCITVPIYELLFLSEWISYRNLRKLHQLLDALHCVEHFNLDFVIVLVCFGLMSPKSNSV